MILLIGWRWFQPSFRLLLGLLVVCWLTNEREEKALRVEVFDVGHGLALALIQQGRAVLYDTGAAWPDGSMANRVVTPNLTALGVTELDGVVVSHGDNDHAGGLKDIQRDWSLSWLRSGRPNQGLPCQKGETWQWQQTEWRVLWPPSLVIRPYNPHSCVIHVTDRISGKRLLLTGDITALVEWMLIRKPRALQADVVIVPHHGSATSSLPQFIERVGAKVAIASTAKGNPWRLPRSEIIHRYTQQGSQWFDTGTDGQISLQFQTSGIDITTQRRKTFEPWYRQMMRNQVE